jgi:hypothetical protein
MYSIRTTHTQNPDHGSFSGLGKSHAQSGTVNVTMGYGAASYQNRDEKMILRPHTSQHSAVHFESCELGFGPCALWGLSLFTRLPLPFEYHRCLILLAPLEQTSKCCSLSNSSMMGDSGACSRVQTRVADRKKSNFVPVSCPK